VHELSYRLLKQILLFCTNLVRLENNVPPVAAVLTHKSFLSLSMVNYAQKNGLIDNDNSIWLTKMLVLFKHQLQVALIKIIKHTLIFSHY